MVQSPLAAASFAVALPAFHVLVCLFDHIVAPPLDGFLKLFSDALTRKGEYEADAYVAKISEEYATALQTSLAKLSISANQDPDIPGFYEALHADHPPFANRWANIDKVKRSL